MNDAFNDKKTGFLKKEILFLLFSDLNYFKRPANLTNSISFAALAA